MNDIAWLLILIGAVAAGVIIIRVLGRIVSWRITLPMLAIALLVSAGLLDIGSALAEVRHLVTNLFGGTT